MLIDAARCQTELKRLFFLRQPERYAHAMSQLKAGEPLEGDWEGLCQQAHDQLKSIPEMAFPATKALAWAKRSLLPRMAYCTQDGLEDLIASDSTLLLQADEKRGFAPRRMADRYGLPEADIAQAVRQRAEETAQRLRPIAPGPDRADRLAKQHAYPVLGPLQEPVSQMQVSERARFLHDLAVAGLRTQLRTALRAELSMPTMMQRLGLDPALGDLAVDAYAQQRSLQSAEDARTSAIRHLHDTCTGKEHFVFSLPERALNQLFQVCEAALEGRDAAAELERQKQVRITRSRHRQTAVKWIGSGLAFVAMVGYQNRESIARMRRDDGMASTVQQNAFVRNLPDPPEFGQTETRPVAFSTILQKKAAAANLSITAPNAAGGPSR